MRILLISDPNISENEPTIMSDGVDNMAYSSADELDSDGEHSEDEGGKVREEESKDEGEEEEEEEDSNSEEESELEQDPESIESNEADGASRKQANREGDRMAAASLCVKVGSFSDPEDLPGLAHFLEHMVFMGSEKFPEENAFDEFLKVKIIVFVFFYICSNN